MILTNTHLVVIAICIILALAYVLGLSFRLSYQKQFKYFPYKDKNYRRHLTKGYYQVQEEHCLGLNPPDYAYTWHDCEDPVEYTGKKSTVIDTVEDPWIHYTTLDSRIILYRYNVVTKETQELIPFNECTIDDSSPLWRTTDKPRWRCNHV